MSDDTRMHFLQDLDEREDVTVSPWEADFLNSCLGQLVGPGPFSFSDKQRKVIDRMFEKYGS